MSKIIPYGRQFIDQSDINLVSTSLKQNLITTGRYVEMFENKISKFLKAKYVISCNSGTSALHLSFCAVNLKKNDVIIMPVVNFVAAYNMASNLGAKVYLTDIDPKTGQMTPKTLTECIKKFKLKKIKIILTMYMGGLPENNFEFYQIKKKYDSIIIEDACHAFGASYFFKNKKYYVGSCKHADISTFSLHPLKPITTGEGGILTTNNKKIYNIAKLLRSHGILKNKKKYWDYDVKKSGFNYRISDLNCALGISQLKKINLFLNKRKKVYNYYKDKLDGFKDIISFPKYSKLNRPTYHLVIINIKFRDLSDKDNFIKHSLKKKIMLQFHYKPITSFSIYRGDKKKLTSSILYYKKSISIPIFHDISKKQIDYIVQTIKKYFSK